MKRGTRAQAPVLAFRRPAPRLQPTPAADDPVARLEVKLRRLATIRPELVTVIDILADDLLADLDRS